MRINFKSVYFCSINKIKLLYNQISSMDQALKKRIFPNQSIKLRPPSPHAPHENICACLMCNQFEHKKKTQLLSTQQAEYRKKLQIKLQSQFICSSLNCDSNAYEWVLSRLIIPSHKIINRGVDIYVPETLFYKDGDPVALYMNKQIQDYRIKKIKRQKINQTYIQKIMNQRRRKYRDQVQILLGQKVVEKKKQIFAKKQQRTDTKDAAIIQFTDKTEQLITQNQLINLMLKRKQDSIWKKISMIKNFITCREASRMIKLNFKYSLPMYPQLFARTRTLMLVYGDNIQATQSQYISEQDQEKFCSQLLKSSAEVFAQYYLYKIVSFVEYFYDDRIVQTECNILINQFDRPYLIDVFSLATKELVKYSWTMDDYIKKIEIEENKIFMNDKELKVNPEIIKLSKSIEDCMNQKYLVEKDNYGLTVDPEDTTEEQNNDRFFSFLHPEFKQDLSHILRTQNISIMHFKKKFLGYVEQKKPLIRPFASKFVKALHNMTPQARFSQSKDQTSRFKEKDIYRSKDEKRQKFQISSSLPFRTFRSRRQQTDKGFRFGNRTSIDFY